MTQVTVPSAGDPIITTWGQSVANHANHIIPLYMTADVSKTGSTMSTITGLTFDCVNGKEYTLDLHLWYDVAGTSTGLSVGFDHPGGTARAIVQIFGASSAITATTEELGTIDTATGTSATDATSIRLIRWTGLYRCTADGTFSLRYERNGTSTTVTIYAGSGGLVVEN